MDSGVGGIINFCLRDSDYQVGQGAIRIEEVIFTSLNRSAPIFQ